VDSPAETAADAGRALVSATLDVREVPLDRLRGEHQNPAPADSGGATRPVLPMAAFNASL